ncbi:hypothetical protein [Haloarchaeobius sp. HRN-SO-5]|uniref:hypothetical protein n=1 Tax=Haloarchaeobius sp. HRN-SO-5 TaxID=3446118 RepID=UPI003EBB542B
MFRRQLLKRGGALAGGGIVLSGTVAARDDGELPNGNVPVSRVHVFGSREDPLEVSMGDWVKHTVGWIDGEGGDSTREDVQRWLDAKEYSAWIDGEPVPDADERYTEPYFRDDDRTGWVSSWKYTTPPKQPGLHTWRSQWHYPDGFSDGQFTIPAGHRAELVSFYEVVQDSNR